MVDITIVVAENDVICFKIGNDTFYFVDNAEVQQIYSAKLEPVMTSNIDMWVHAKSQHRHSLQSLRDMATAFKLGVAAAYDGDSVYKLCADTATATKDVMLKRGFVPQYGRLYWVEVLDPVKLESLHGKSLRVQFDTLRKKLGDNKLYESLCRLWFHCHIANEAGAVFFENLIARLGKTPQEPIYPNTDKLDSELVKYVLKHLVDAKLTKYRSMPADVMGNMHELHSRRLQRAKRVRALT